MVAPPARNIDVAEWKRTHEYKVIYIDSTETIDITFDFSEELTTGASFLDPGPTITPYTQTGETVMDTVGGTVTIYLRGPAVADGTETVITCTLSRDAYSTSLISIGACILRQRNN